MEFVLIPFLFIWHVGSGKMWGDSPRQPEESSDDERSYSRMLRCLQDTGWVWFVCGGSCS